MIVPSLIDGPTGKEQDYGGSSHNRSVAMNSNGQPLDLALFEKNRSRIPADQVRSLRRRN
jgi:hypothetical protein